MVFTREGEEVLVCPTFVTGGKDWEAGAYSPLTKLMYYPLRNACARMMATRVFADDTPAARTESRSEVYAIAYQAPVGPGHRQRRHRAGHLRRDR